MDCLVEDTGTSVLMVEDVDTVVSLVCDVVLLAVSDVSLLVDIGKQSVNLLLPAVVRISADQINPSASLLAPSIIASFHFILGLPSWTSTTSPILTLCSLFPVTL